MRSATAQPIVVGSKDFEESRLLAEMFARLLEERAGLEVERQFNLAGTQVCFEALRTGAIDLYPERAVHRRRAGEDEAGTAAPGVVSSAARHLNSEPGEPPKGRLPPLLRPS